MPSFKRRTHVVFFRVTEEEFLEILRICESAGVTSVSEFARTATRKLMMTGATDKIDAITKNVCMIEEGLNRVLSKIQSLSGDEAVTPREESAGAEVGESDRKRAHGQGKA